MRSKVFSRILILVIFITSLVTINVFADSTADNYNNYAYPMSTYKKPVLQPFSIQTAGQEENVDPASGNLEIRQTDLSLKGRNGLDFNLTRSYSTSDAKLYEPYCIQSENYTLFIAGYYVSGTETKETYINGAWSKTSRSVYLGASTSGESFAELPVGYQGNNYWMYSQQAQKMADDLNSGVYDDPDINLSENAIVEVKKYSTKGDFVVRMDTKWYAMEGQRNQFLNSTITNMNDAHFNLGIGWSFDIPYIDKEYDKYFAKYLNKFEDTNLVNFDVPNINLNTKEIKNLKNNNFNYATTYSNILKIELDDKTIDSLDENTDILLRLSPALTYKEGKNIDIYIGKINKENPSKTLLMFYGDYVIDVEYKDKSNGRTFDLERLFVNINLNI